MKKLVLVLGMAAIVFQLVYAPVAFAKLYTWIDKSGVTRRTYYPPPADQVMTNKQKRQTPVNTKKKTNQVELYVTSWCPYCTKAITFFRSRGIKVKVYDIEKDRKAAARKQKMNRGGGVPFAVVNGKYISGYAPAQYTKALR